MPPPLFFFIFFFIPLNILAWCLSPALSLAGEMSFLWDLSWGKVEPDMCDSDRLPCSSFLGGGCPSLLYISTSHGSQCTCCPLPSHLPTCQNYSEPNWFFKSPFPPLFFFSFFLLLLTEYIDVLKVNLQYPDKISPLVRIPGI